MRELDPSLYQPNQLASIPTLSFILAVDFPIPLTQYLLLVVSFFTSQYHFPLDFPTVPLTDFQAFVLDVIVLPDTMISDALSVVDTTARIQLDVVPVEVVPVLVATTLPENPRAVFSLSYTVWCPSSVK